LELKKAFVELQQKNMETKQQLKIADMQIEGLKKSVHYTTLTKGELDNIPQGVRTYEGVGRIFICESLDEIKKHMDEKTKGLEEKIKALETNKSYLQNNLKESENNIRELVQQKQAKA